MWANDQRGMSCYEAEAEDVALVINGTDKQHWDLWSWFRAKVVSTVTPALGAESSRRLSQPLILFLHSFRSLLEKARLSFCCWILFSPTSRCRLGWEEIVWKSPCTTHVAKSEAWPYKSYQPHSNPIDLVRPFRVLKMLKKRPIIDTSDLQKHIPLTGAMTDPKTSWY